MHKHNKPSVESSKIKPFYLILFQPGLLPQQDIREDNQLQDPEFFLPLLPLKYIQLYAYVQWELLYYM